VRGHWRIDAFRAEGMAPSLLSADQVSSTVTVAALRNPGWALEPEACEEFTLPDVALTASSSARSQRDRSMFTMTGRWSDP